MSLNIKTSRIASLLRSYPSISGAMYLVPKVQDAVDAYGDDDCELSSRETADLIIAELTAYAKHGHDAMVLQAWRNGDVTFVPNEK